MSALHRGLGLSESFVHRSLPVFPVRLIIRACHRQEDNYRVSLRSLLSPCPMNGNTLRSETLKTTGRQRRLLSLAPAYTKEKPQTHKHIFHTVCPSLVAKVFIFLHSPLDSSYFSPSLLICDIRSSSPSPSQRWLPVKLSHPLFQVLTFPSFSLSPSTSFPLS